MPMKSLRFSLDADLCIISAMSLTLKLVNDNAGSTHFKELVRRVWGSPDDDLVPIHVSITIAKNGGALLAAYAEDGPAETGGMVGATLWWLGTDAHSVSLPDAPGLDVPQQRANQPSLVELKVCSHMAGVLPEWQGRGVGLRLKLTQRHLVLRQGLTDRITWTYDPLYLPNGVFNIHRLGAVCNTYLRNVYGDMQDALNRGVPSDRCQVDWHLNSPRVVEAATMRPSPRDWHAWDVHVLPTEAAGAFRRPVPQSWSFNGQPIAVPIPDDIAAIRAVDGELSLAWRLYMRDVLENAFAHGYRMVDCARFGSRGWHYVLVHEVQD
jgi:predicted GNAT superfamily acetyltransferase